MSNTATASPQLLKASFEVGKQAGQLLNTFEQKAKENHLEEKALEAKAKAMERYKQETGRNASVDGTILKYSAIATVGAVAISMAPAVIVGTAVGGAVVAAASTQVNTAITQYSVATGRDGDKDKQLLEKFAKDTKDKSIQALKGVKEGFESVRASK